MKPRRPRGDLQVPFEVSSWPAGPEVKKAALKGEYYSGERAWCTSASRWNRSRQNWGDREMNINVEKGQLRGRNHTSTILSSCKDKTLFLVYKMRSYNLTR